MTTNYIVALLGKKKRRLTFDGFANRWIAVAGKRQQHCHNILCNIHTQIFYRSENLIVDDYIIVFGTYTLKN